MTRHDLLREDIAYHEARRSECDCECKPGWHSQMASDIKRILDRETTPIPHGPEDLFKAVR